MDKIKTILNKIFTEALMKRTKSFFWRLSCVSLVAGISWAIDNLGLLEVSIPVQGVLGLILGEITKEINNSTDIFGKSIK